MKYYVDRKVVEDLSNKVLHLTKALERLQNNRDLLYNRVVEKVNIIQELEKRLCNAEDLVIERDKSICNLKKMLLALESEVENLDRENMELYLETQKEVLTEPQRVGLVSQFTSFSLEDSTEPLNAFRIPESSYSQLLDRASEAVKHYWSDKNNNNK